MTTAPPFKIKMVEKIYESTREERMKWLEKCDYNLFNLSSEKVYIDLLTDSGTGAMSTAQFAQMFLGDEAYAGSASFYQLKDNIEDIFQMNYVLPTHQGRAAENVLFSSLLKENDIVLGNAHFDTTKAHIEFRKAEAIDCSCDEAYDTKSMYEFKGNINLDKLKCEITKAGESCKLIVVTITCNNNGGQPVSLENLKAVYEIAKDNNIQVCFDSARFAENAYFIKEREGHYKDWSIKEIVKQMYQYCDMMTMSCKKDALVNIGGFVAFRNEELYQSCQTYAILYEGFITYGGLAGRDLGAIAVGLTEVVEYDYLHSRVQQVRYLANQLDKHDIPYLKPVGGHAIYIISDKFLSHIPREEFPAQTLACELYLDSGVRGVEIGTILADRDPNTRENRYPQFDLLRLCLPRRTYTDSHVDIVAKSLINLYRRRDKITKGLTIIWEAPIIRHFTVKLARVGTEVTDDVKNQNGTANEEDIASLRAKKMAWNGIGNSNGNCSATIINQE